MERESTESAARAFTKINPSRSLAALTDRGTILTRSASLNITPGEWSD
jgi:hypothetical protein